MQKIVRTAIVALATLAAVNACESPIAPMGDCVGAPCNGVQFSRYHPDTSYVQFQNIHGGSVAVTAKMSEGVIADRLEIWGESENGSSAMAGILSRNFGADSIEYAFLPYAAKNVSANDRMDIKVRMYGLPANVIIARFSFPVVVSPEVQTVSPDMLPSGPYSHRPTGEEDIRSRFPEKDGWKFIYLNPNLVQP